MARPKKQENNEKLVWAICINYPDKTCGWLLGNDLEVKTYSSPEEAEKALKQIKRGDHYSWNLPVEVKEFTGFSHKKESVNEDANK